MNISKLLTAAIGAAECVAMHNRVKDVASDNDDNDECADGKLARTTDRNCLDGIDIRKYSNFRTLFHSLKKRNDPPVNINRIMYLSPVKDRSRHGIAFGLESCLTSQSFQQANVTSQSSNDKYVLRSCEMSKKSQPITFSDVNFTKIPINCSTEKLKLFINKQTLSTELTPFSKTTDKMKTTRGTFDLLLSSNKVKMRTDEEKSRKIADVTTPLESPNLPNGTNKTTKTIVALSEVQVPCSSLFSRSFEYLTRKKKEETERTKEDTVTRRLSFDATWSTAKKKYLERSSELDIALTNREEMDGRTLVHLNRKSTDCDWRRPSEKDNNDSNKSSSKRDKKEASFDETSSLEFESCANANKSQEINTLRDINKTLATKLARAERIAQLLQIQLKFYEKTNDVKFACKFADVINQLKLLLPSDQFRDEALEILNSASPSVNFNDEKAIILDTLLKEIECDERELLNPETLRKNCERLLEYARKHPPVFMELQNQINEHNHILRLKNNAEIMMKDAPNGDLIDGGCGNYQNQIASLEANLVLYREQLAMKDVQLQRLEEEIGNAHRCNQQLNAKLGSMVTVNSANFLNQERELRKTLKERTSECDSLKKKLEKFERDRQQWENQKRALEAKQPMDVQMLQGQKRELTMQLDREQAEKQELFLQINSLIAQLADANRDTSDLRELKDENTMLKNQIIDIQAIQKQLNADVQNLQEEIRRKNQEVESAQEESKKLRSTIENEKIQLESSIGELQRDLQIKSAALQSLMLAKQDTKISEADSALINRLTVENEDLREQIDEIKNEVKKRVSEIEDVKSENEKERKNLQSELEFVQQDSKKKELELSKQNDEIAKLRSELNSVLEDVKKREAELAAMQDKVSKEVYETSQLRETLDRSKLDMEKINKQLEESQKNLAECEQKYEAMKKDSETKLSLEKEILADVNKKYEEEIRQQEMRFNNLKQSLRMQEMRTDEAEQEAKNNRMKITDLEKELKMLRMQTDKQRTVDEQLRLLREELKEAKHQIAAQAADLEKAEIDADEAERSTRETIDELEEEVHFLQEKVKILEVSKEEQCSRLSIAEKELKEHRETSEKYEKKCEALTKSLEELRTALTDSHITLEKFKIENEKLMAKASLEDEVLTLATSLQSARDEISVKHDEIAKLRKELRELHDRNERLLMDFEIQTQALQQDAQSARAECDEVRKEMEKCKSNNSIQQERDSLLLTKLRNEISNLEEQIIEKEKVFSSVRNDLELKHQKMLIETKQQYEQKITELREEVEQLRASESEKIDELNIVMSNLRKELAVKSGSFASSRTGLYQEFENQKERSVDLSPRSDFEEKLASLKECIADVLEEKLLFEQGDFQPILINKATQTMLKVEDGRHIISVNDDDEESLGPRDKNILLPRREISNFNRSYVNKSYNTDSEQIWRSKSSSEVWNLRAELAFLKKQIADDEMSKKRLQKHIQMLETTLHGKEGVLDLMKETKKDVKSDNHNNLRESLSPVTEQVEKLKTELQNALECSERCRRELQERDLDVASLKKDNEKLTNEIRSYKMRLNESIDVEDRNRVLEYENRNLLDDNSLLKVKLTKLRDQFAEAENKSLQRHMEEVTNLNQQLDKARQAYELSGAEMSRLQEQSANLSKEVNHLRNFLNIANTEKEQLKAEACEHRKELDRLSGERMELEVTRQQLNEAIAEGEHQAQEIARLKAQTEGDESLEKDRQQELHTLRQEIVTVEEKWKMKYKKSEANVEAAKKDLQKLTETNDTLIENIKRLSNELDLERKKVIDLGAEGTRLLDEVEKLRNELDMLRRQEENSPDMKKKLSELMAENAQLAGELLKKHSLVNRKSSKEDQEMEEPLEKHDECWKCKGKSSEEEIREELKSVMEDSEKRLQQCNEKWAVKLKNQAEILEREMAEVRAENEELRSQNERMRSEISEIELEKKKSKQLSEKLNDTEERLKELESNLSRLKAANNTPTPPPRKRSENEATADGLSQVSLTDENKKLKKDIEMQHRLIVVLRRKLQSMQQQQQ